MDTQTGSVSIGLGMNFMELDLTKTHSSKLTFTLAVNSGSRPRCSGRTAKGEKCMQYRGLNPANGMCYVHDPLDRTNMPRRRRRTQKTESTPRKKARRTPKKQVIMPNIPHADTLLDTSAASRSRYSHHSPIKPYGVLYIESPAVVSKPHWGCYDITQETIKPTKSIIYGDSIVPPLYPVCNRKAPSKCAIGFITHDTSNPLPSDHSYLCTWTDVLHQ